MRTCRDLNDSWYFTKNSFGEVPETVSEQWEKISLPHTWNALDGQDGGSDYYRGPCWYMRKIEVSDQELDKEIYLEIGAASSFCEVYVNGEKAGEHAGGYSLFRMNITDMLRAGNNVFSIMVSNEAQDDIYPQMADFTFYGGLYRYVKLLTVEKSHFDLDYYGGSGVQIDSKITKPGCAILHMRSFLCAPREGDRILYTVYDGEHQEIAQAECPARKQTEVRLFLTDLRLWQGVEDPYLYQIEVSLVRHNDVIDQVQVRHGFREFHVDPQKGFYLNDVLTPLRGVSRHQDKLGVGNALTREEHLLDAELIRELGANTIRLAHYQHSQDFYDICDEMGFIVWAEIPFISRMNSCSQAHQNCISQMKELIIQNYNHSSIVVWGISNEITIGGSVPGLTENLKELNELVHSLDSTRLSTMAQVSTLPMEDEQNEITDILSYNHYFGWYQGSFTDNEKWLDTFHAMHPDRALGLSEYGCEGIITYHNDSPKAGDYSEEYQALYHEHMAKIIEERPWLWATHIWNMFDFGCDARDEGGVAGRNNKGLMTLDRKIKKDAFYLYQAYWSKTPMVHICSKRYALRTEEEITVKVYSNCPKVQLYMDGEFFVEEEGYRVFSFEHVPLHEGFTTVTAKTERNMDSCAFQKVSEAFEGYHFVQDTSELGVTNWFETADLETERPMTFYEDCYSIKDTVKKVLESDEAGTILVNAFSSVTGMQLKKSMLMMMGDNTLEALFAQKEAAAKMNLDIEAVKAYLNEQLQGIKKQRGC